MKKLFVLLFVLGITLPVFAQLDSKQLVGSWKYTAVTDQGNISGVFKFTEAEGKLSGEVITTEGYILPLSKIEIREENNLYFEIQTDNDIIKLNLKVEGNKFKGTGSSYMGEAPVTGIKQE